MLVRHGEVVREYLEDPTTPGDSVDRGLMECDLEPLRNWIDVARFVDDDTLGFHEAGWLWLY